MIRFCASESAWNHTPRRMRARSMARPKRFVMLSNKSPTPEMRITGPMAICSTGTSSESGGKVIGRLCDPFHVFTNLNLSYPQNARWLALPAAQRPRPERLQHLRRHAVQVSSGCSPERGWWMRYGSVPHERRKGKDQCNDRSGNSQDQSEPCG